MNRVIRSSAKHLLTRTFGLRFLCFVFLAILILGQYCQIASALSPEQLKVFQSGINYFDIATACTSAPSGVATVNSNGTLDITNIVSKYNLQSAMIQKLGGNNPLASYKANQPPTTPASTMKLIIADTALQSGLDLTKTVQVRPDVYYSGQNDLGKSTVTLEYAMQQMLSSSSNVGANVLMKAMGGVDSFTQKAHNYGYNNTIVKGYYDPSNDGKNTSTIQDEVNAMSHIFSVNTGDYQTAQNALKDAAQNDNHYGVDDIANKWAGTSQVAGNVGLFNINGSQYIIGLYYNGSIDTSKDNTISSASADLMSAVQNTASNSSPSPGNCCPPSGGGDVTSLSGKDNIEKVINFFVAEGLSPAQAAGVAANFAWETGGGTNIDPLVSGSDPNVGAWGIAQWTPGSKYVQDKQQIGITGSDSDLLTQLQVVWAEMNGKGSNFSNVVDGLKKINDAGDAANYFRTYFEGCDTSNASCTSQRPETAKQFAAQYSGGSLPGGLAAGGGGGCAGLGNAQQGTVAAAVAAAKQLSGYKVGYVWGGLHGPGQLDITDESKLQQIGADCSGSVSWVLHQAGMFNGNAGIVSGDFGSWGQAGKGQQMTIWENADHIFIEFNVPGVGHYQLNTVAPGNTPSTTPGATGPGPRFYRWGPPGGDTSGFTPRHWPGT